MTPRRPNRHARYQRLVGILFATLIIVTIVGHRRSPVAQALADGRPVPILLFGIDAADASHHTDTLMLAVWDPVKDLLRVLSIPRDTRVHIPGYRFRRINEIYGYHRRTKGDPAFAARKVAEGVEHVLSTDDARIRLPYHLRIDFGVFRRLVDLVGGVWVTVKTPMHYDDYAGGYHFHKEPGRYLMNGDDALKYVRFRGATGDRGRIFRTQAFLRGMARRAANPLNALRFPQMASVAAKSVETSLSFWDFVFLAHSARRLRPGGLNFYILPGRPSGPYWRVNDEAANALAAFLLLGRPLPEDQLQPIVRHEATITVKVWNASGRRGWAHDVTRYLRENGFDVVDWGNYPVNQVPTRVIDRVGRIAQAQAVGNVLSIESVHSEPSRSALADVEVVIGRNYAGIGTMN